MIEANRHMRAMMAAKRKGKGCHRWVEGFLEEGIFVLRTREQERKGREGASVRQAWRVHSGAGAG